MHPLLANTSATYEDLAAWRAIWLTSHPRGITLLIGSHEWVVQQHEIARRQGRRFVPVKALKEAYRTLDDREVMRINTHRDTLTGMELDATLINHLELVLGLRALTTQQLDCWLLHTRAGKTYEQLGVMMDKSVEAITETISAAGRRLQDRIFEPFTVVIHL